MPRPSLLLLSLLLVNLTQGDASCCKQLLSNESFHVVRHPIVPPLKNIPKGPLLACDSIFSPRMPLLSSNELAGKQETISFEYFGVQQLVLRFPLLPSFSYQGLGGWPTLCGWVGGTQCCPHSVHTVAHTAPDDVLAANWEPAPAPA